MYMRHQSQEARTETLPMVEEGAQQSISVRGPSGQLSLCVS